MASTTKNELPKDVIFNEILSRLPTKSLVRFRCVSKTWNSVFFEPQFAKSHLTYQNPKERWWLMYGSYLFDCKDIMVSGSIQAPIHIVPLTNSDIIGAINGLVCFVFREKFSLWNPAIRQYKEITISSELLHTESKCSKHVYGFGWDPVGNDYKVVILCNISKQCAVYSSKSDSWTQLASVPILAAGSYASFKSIPCTIVKQCPYWTYSKYLPGNMTCAAVYKFVAEKNEFRLLPDFDCSVIGELEFNLASLRDSLVGMVYNYERINIISEFVDIYSLNQEGPDGVWSRMYKVKLENFRILGINNVGMKHHLTFYQRLGEVLYCYDPRTNNKKDVVDQEAVISSRCDNCFSYTPSLVFVPGMKPLTYLQRSYILVF